MATRQRKRKAPDADLDVEQLNFKDDAELRAALKEVGISAGPIDSSNRLIYQRHYLLKRRKLEEQSTEASPTLVDPGSSLSPVKDSTTPKSKGTTPKQSSASKQPGAAKRAGRNKDVASSEQAIKNFQLEGLIAAVYTPFKDNKERDVNLSGIAKYARHLVSTGVKGVFVNGTTGEGLSLTMAERKTVAEQWVKDGTDKLKIVVHVGTENLKNTCELAKHASQIGAAAIGVMPTTFFKPGSMDVLIQYLSEVADCAPTLPMYYYHIPGMTGVSFSMEKFLDVASTRLPTLRGIKYTDFNLFEFGRCVTAQEGRYQVIYGSDEQLIGALALGGTAAIGSTYNFAGTLYNRLMMAYASKDTEEAKLEQRRAQAVVRIYFSHGTHSDGLGKAIMKMCGVDCGPTRLPYTTLTTEKANKLQKDLDEIGFFVWR